MQTLTPTEILIKYPTLATEYGWTINDIGILVRMKIITGIKSRKFHNTHINEKSLLRLLEHLNIECDRKKIAV